MAKSLKDLVDEPREVRSSEVLDTTALEAWIMDRGERAGG